MPTDLNRFQKRLVHQLIEVEYPSLVTVSRPGFIQIIDYDEQREKAVRDQRVKWVQERIWKQTGFRWIAEALAGGDLTNLEPFCFINLMSSSKENPQSSLQDFSRGVKQRLQKNRPVLVGHNLFTDLIYFCRCFFGPLPDRVEDFQAMAHEMFPVLMDTKYMATHNCGSINPRSSLQEINDSLAKQPTPAISRSIAILSFLTNVDQVYTLNLPNTTRGQSITKLALIVCSLLRFSLNFLPSSETGERRGFRQQFQKHLNPVKSRRSPRSRL